MAQYLVRKPFLPTVSIDATTVSFKLQCPTSTTSQVGALMPVQIANSNSGAKVEFDIRIFATPSAKFLDAVPPFATRTDQVILGEHHYFLG